MNRQQALDKLIPPGRKRPGKWREGVIQVWVTSMCDKSCHHCTQASNYARPKDVITLENFEEAIKSLQGYFGVVGIFGGNPALHPEFPDLCDILAQYIPFEQRGLWCNKAFGHGPKMRDTFNPKVSNINVHLDQEAHDEFRRDWPEVPVVGLGKESRHPPVYVALKDVIESEEERWDLIANCDINIHWSAMIGQFRGEVRAWFCEVAGSQAMLHQWESDYPDTGVPLSVYTNQDPHTGVIGSFRSVKWWEQQMPYFAHQVDKHCMECGVPLRGYGELSQADGIELVSLSHENVARLKNKKATVHVVKDVAEIRKDGVGKLVSYLENSSK